MELHIELHMEFHMELHMGLHMELHIDFHIDFHMELMYLHIALRHVGPMSVAFPCVALGYDQSCLSIVCLHVPCKCVHFCHTI